MKNVVFIGPPGCGKGTQASALIEQYGYIKVSTGDLLRDIAKRNDTFGSKIKSLLERGILVSDEIVNDLISNFYRENKDKEGVIFDGYPRSISQAKSLDLMLNHYNAAIDVVFYFDIAEEFLVKRITGRYTCTNCGAIYNQFFSNTKVQGECDMCHSKSFNRRTDDTEVVIKERLKIYNESTAPLLEYYKDKITKIDAAQSVELVSKIIVDYLK
jgi:adenylate kinase